MGKKMFQLQQKINKMLSAVLEKVFGAKTLSSFFSYKGRVGKNQFFFVMVLIGFCTRCVSSYIVVRYFVALFLFYAVLAAVQKRCRDFGSQGTFYVIVYTIFFVVYITTYFLVEHDIPKPWVYLYIPVIMTAVIMQVIAFVVLSYKDSKSEADMNLRSPLLKYPLLYVGVCWILMIAGTLAVNHFAGIEVALF